MATVYRRPNSPKYYGVYTDPNGKRVRRSTGTTNRQDAQRIAQKWEADANAMKHGLHMGKVGSLQTLIDEYVAYLGNSGAQYRELCQQRVTRVCDANEWTRPQQINQLQLETAVRGFLNLNTEKPLSVRSQAHYITAMKSFTRWLVRLRGALVRDPLEAVRKPNFAPARKLVRRFLLHEEWYWLAQTPNALLYETAIQTGFRSSELRMLRPAHLHSDHILLPAQYTKNKQQAKQWITPDLAKRLATALPFDLPPKQEIARMLYADLAIARDAWLAAGHKTPADFLVPRNTLDHVLDFHALRHTCGAWLAIAGTNPKVIQSVMRHSTIVLTLDCYGHLLPGAESTAAMHLGELLTNLRAVAPEVCQQPGK
jgi:integrase